MRMFRLAMNHRALIAFHQGTLPKELKQRIGVIISDEPRINDEIRVPQVRLIGPKGEQVGVIATTVALNLAKEANLDLVEVAPNAKPPVAKLIDYGKFKYNEKIKAREARRNQSTAEIKEIRFRLKIDDHDFDVKKGHVTRFLNGGDKVKVTIMLRGREISRPIGGVELLQRLADDVEEFGTVESKPKQEGRNIIMTLAPKARRCIPSPSSAVVAPSPAPSVRLVRRLAWRPSRSRRLRPRPMRRPRFLRRLPTRSKPARRAAMPKMKTNSAASKRARITGSGKVMQAGSAMRHNLEHKSARKRRALSADAVLRGGQAKKLHQLLQK